MKIKLLKGLILTAFIVFFLSGISSCKSAPSAGLEPEPSEPYKDAFLGVYSTEFPAEKSGISVYSVEFKADKTARVLLFKKAGGQTSAVPKIIQGNWLLGKDGVIVLYFPNNVPSEFFFKNEDGSLSFLDDNKKPYTGSLKEIMVLKKLNTP
ncbi:hypothetical protein [Treponema pedis]|uniref:Lipoprotein n=1 Tax=Treponema pedis str. T A4 TaxID=1291379 RepID=S5ZM02_9SPIR|nr:hypothetical protein [Treponema pedis]AGT43597.1 hypothetical protein TPE_1101 [Treponema pedis str. T A4]